MSAREFVFADPEPFAHPKFGAGSAVSRASPIRGGGWAADYVIDHLRHTPWNYWDARESEIYSPPAC